MTLEGKIIISLLVVLAGGGTWAYCHLDQRLRVTQQQSAVSHCPVDTSGQSALGLLSQSIRAEAASHSYFERLLEALIRHAGLPLELAREALKKDLPGGLPLGWRWLEPWEGKPPAPPASATPR